jgi:hypothetical protein
VRYTKTEIETVRAVGLSDEAVQDLQALLEWARGGRAWRQLVVVCKLLAQRGVGHPPSLPAHGNDLSTGGKMMTDGLTAAASSAGEKPARGRRLPSGAALAKLDAAIDDVARGAAFPNHPTRGE